MARSTVRGVHGHLCTASSGSGWRHSVRNTRAPLPRMPSHSGFHRNPHVTNVADLWRLGVDSPQHSFPSPHYRRFRGIRTTQPAGASSRPASWIRGSQADRPRPQRGLRGNTGGRIKKASARRPGLSASLGRLPPSRRRCRYSPGIALKTWNNTPVRRGNAPGPSHPRARARSRD